MTSKQSISADLDKIVFEAIDRSERFTISALYQKGQTITKIKVRNK